jgi:hypothetical protein
MSSTPSTETDAKLDPGPIIELGSAFWGSKTLLSAIELGVFTELADEPLSLDQARKRLGLHERSARDFLDALVALGMLERTEGRYADTPLTAAFLDRRTPGYVGGMLEMANSRLYPFWNALTEALQTGQPQNEIAEGGNLFDTLYADEGKLRQFAHAMTGISLGAAQAIAERFPFERYATFVDIGCAEGALPAQVALRHPHITGGGFDLPLLEPIFSDYVASLDLGARLAFHAGDFWTDELPAADVLAMGHILHDWNLAEKVTLIEKAHAALPHGGALIVHDALIDDARREHAFGLLMSLNMLIETHGGFDYTGADCVKWMHAAGFTETRVEHLAGPDWMVVGIK